MKKLAWLIVSPLFASPLFAADLMQVYRTAQDNDPTFAAARSVLDAGREKAPQGRAGLLPSLSLSGNTVWNENEISPHNGSTPTKARYNSNGYQLTLSQPLFRWQNWVSYDQAKIQVVQAEVNFTQARQDLILRVAQAYFDVNYATENLKAVKANKSAIGQQLESAKKNFEVGTATITDTHEAQARFDLASAQEISAESDLEVKQHALAAILGKEPGLLAVVRKDAPLTPPQPNDMSQWVAAAEKDSLAVQVQQANADIAARELDKQRAGHYPTLDLVANKGYSKSFLQAYGGAYDTDVQNIGLQLNIPLFQGGLVVSRQREAAANRNAAESSLEATRRGAALSARQYYLGVVNGLAQVRALQAALVSSQSALESNKLGYEVGVRINIDVLNAENQVYVTRRDLAKATLDTLMAQLRLKAAVGALGDDDVAQINSLLDPSSAQ
ncbi:TolC family outer membrane protein [Quatrionicoccus australiensis]|uniref:TolC family outer membrane protein n=1 Tax=Quatrionicoccus australiensis TaxID=138118 RepID=UPI001CFC3F5E|nr:TolC family outer membrane protein [Quatrionicoccus australiensis]MCB4359800.1 TolC family outer membrane protein [Quatrionicoccus australiensis]